MNYQEFTAQVKALVGQTVYSDVPMADFEIINTVYNFHPAIPDVGGKGKIAKVYVDLGMSVIRDMLPRAERFRWHEERLAAAMAAVDKIKTEMKEDTYGSID